MKKHSDPRHLARRKAVQALFAWDFHKETASLTQVAKDKRAQGLARGTIGNLERIDEIIQSSAPTWPVAQISKVDLAILRLAVFELCFKKTAPPKVVIDEAVELAKEFGGETAPGFVNGVLGTVLKEIKILNSKH